MKDAGHKVSLGSIITFLLLRLSLSPAIAQETLKSPAMSLQSFTRMLPGFPAPIVRQLYDIYIGSATTLSFEDMASAPALQPIDTPDSSFRFGAVSVSTNLATSQKPRFHIEAGIADSVSIRIYTLSWTSVEMIREIWLYGPPGLIDRGKGPVYAFEYEWDASQVDAGPYQYVVSARKSGYPSIQTTGRIWIIK